MILRFSDYDFKIKKEGTKSLIYDIVRRKFVTITPEEWVRQHLVHYMIFELDYPKALVAVEMPLLYNNMKRRSDIVVFDREGKPSLIVECKAPDVKLSQKAFDQIARYNMTLKVGYLVVSNGHDTFCCSIDHNANAYRFLDSIPAYKNLETIS